LKDVLAIENPTLQIEPDDATRLLGRGAVLDSLGLVQLILALEGELRERHAIEVALADERAMSQQHSPFRTVGSLTEYICQVTA
jgi:acyl carrier protein